jgi:CDP-6-deoxy-D-xylo-4-hexulose-3-dehydrase
MTETSIPASQFTKDKIRKQILSLVKEYANLEFAPKKFVPGQTVVPPSGKLIGSEELENMVEASLDGWLTTGRFNDLFEKKLAEFIGVKHLITVNSGSSANLIALSTLTSSKLKELYHDGLKFISTSSS